MYYLITQKNKMTDFKKNISKVSKEKKEAYFQIPKDFQKYVDKKLIQKNSLEKTKKRLEEQLETRKKYVKFIKWQIK